MALPIPAELAANCRKTPERAAWLKRLPHVLGSLERRWALTLGVPFEGEEASCSWVAPAARADGTSAIVKLGMPHMEGEHELHGLRFWNGDPTVRLLDADEELGAMLLERCVPGTALRDLPESDQDMEIARLLRALALAIFTAPFSAALDTNGVLEQRDAGRSQQVGGCRPGS